MQLEQHCLSRFAELMKLKQKITEIVKIPFCAILITVSTIQKLDHQC